MRFCSLAIVTVLGGVVSAARAASPVEDGFCSLFDGRTLQGWTIKSKPADKDLAAKKYWTVDNGSILADSMGHKEHDYV